MKHKIISLAGALALTVGTFAATAADVAPIPKVTIDEGIAVCRVATRQLMRGDRGRALQEALDIIPNPEYKRAQGMVCKAYLEGFRDGVTYIGERV